VSPPLSGTFGQLMTNSAVNATGSFVTTLPSGITLGISFPSGINVTSLQIANIDSSRISLISKLLNVVNFDDELCDLGCKITFYFNKNDFQSVGTIEEELRIFHDSNDDNSFSFDEILIPKITRFESGLFSVSVIVNSFSTIGFGFVPSGGGGGGGDEIPPDFKSFEVITCDPGIGCGTHVAKEIKFENDMPTAKLPVGHTSKLILRVHENSGPSALQHVSMYLNVHGYGSFIQDSDTFIRFNMGDPITVKDPHGYFSDAKISLTPRGNNIDVNFFLTFDKPMEKTDVIIRAWDYSRNSRDAIFRDALVAVEMLLPDDKILEPDTQIIPSLLIPEEIISGWAGYSTDVVTDEELLDQLGIDGKSIPSWYKEIVSKWVFDGSISHKEFVDALSFFAENEKLGG